jgi:hypothetical protein
MWAGHLYEILTLFILGAPLLGPAAGQPVDKLVQFSKFMSRGRALIACFDLPGGEGWGVGADQTPSIFMLQISYWKCTFLAAACYMYVQYSYREGSSTFLKPDCFLHTQKTQFNWF